jgi:hypothetical protein
VEFGTNTVVLQVIGEEKGTQYLVVKLGHPVSGDINTCPRPSGVGESRI